MIPFKTMLVAADYSEASIEAFHVACSLAREGHTRVIVLNVLDPTFVPEAPIYAGEPSYRFIRVPCDLQEHADAKARLREEYRPSRPLPMEFLTAEGESSVAILAAAGDHGCDLIVMDTHGRTGLRRLLTGSVAETVLREASCPILALRSSKSPHEPGPVRTVLHATDFSQSSEPALWVARELARAHQARLIVLHVTPPMVAADGMAVVQTDSLVDQAALESIRSRVEGPDLNAPVETRRDVGGAAFAILRMAGDEKADWIVMGSHGRSGLGRLLLGSESEAVLRRANCPVLIIKPSAVGSNHEVVSQVVQGGAPTSAAGV